MWEMIRIILPRTQQAKGEETNQQLMYLGQQLEGRGGGVITRTPGYPTFSLVRREREK